jgi:hypothetical protein
MKVVFVILLITLNVSAAIAEFDHDAEGDVTPSRVGSGRGRRVEVPEGEAKPNLGNARPGRAKFIEESEGEAKDFQGNNSQGGYAIEKPSNLRARPTIAVEPQIEDDPRLVRKLHADFKLKLKFRPRSEVKEQALERKGRLLTSPDDKTVRCIVSISDRKFYPMYYGLEGGLNLHLQDGETDFLVSCLPQNLTMTQFRKVMGRDFEVSVR